MQLFHNLMVNIIQTKHKNSKAIIKVFNSNKRYRRISVLKKKRNAYDDRINLARQNRYVSSKKLNFPREHICKNLHVSSRRNSKANKKKSRLARLQFVQKATAVAVTRNVIVEKLSRHTTAVPSGSVVL